MSRQYDTELICKSEQGRGSIVVAEYLGLIPNVLNRKYEEHSLPRNSISLRG